MRKGPEVFFFSRLDFCPKSHKARERRGKANRTPQKSRGGREGGEKGREVRSCSHPRPPADARRQRGAARSPGGGGAQRGRRGRGLRSRLCVPSPPLPKRVSPYCALITPNPGGTFPASLGFFLPCFVLEAKAFESPSRTGIKVSFFKSY